MRTLAAAFAVLALATPAQASPRFFDETEHISRTLQMDPGGTLRLKNFSGRVTITASDRPEVVIDAVRRATVVRPVRYRVPLTFASKPRGRIALGVMERIAFRLKRRRPCRTIALGLPGGPTSDSTRVPTRTTPGLMIVPY